jgi:hypothetical protein
MTYQELARCRGSAVNKEDWLIAIELVGGICRYRRMHVAFYPWNAKVFVSV